MAVSAWLSGFCVLSFSETGLIHKFEYSWQLTEARGAVTAMHHGDILCAENFVSQYQPAESCFNWASCVIVVT